MKHEFVMSEANAELIHALIDSHTSALKNWIASAVECGDLERAQGLVKDLRKYQNLYKAFNMKSKRELAKFAGRPIVSRHEVLDA